MADRPPRPTGRDDGGVPASRLELLHACPVCRRPRLRHYCRVPSLFTPGEFIHYERCRDCGTVLRNPRLPPDQRLAKYEDKVLPAADKQLQPRSQAHYRVMMRAIDRLYPPGAPRRLLDFGCGAGGFLVAARDAGFEPCGLELNRDLARHVETAHGIPVYRGLVDDDAFAGERFNVIVSSQVFEHLLDPRATLAELRRHLDPPGLLLIEVPNLRALAERLRRGATMDDSHLFYFSAASLPWMLRREGFEVLRVEEGLRPYRFAPGAADRLPLALLRAGERLASWLQVKTGLGVLARLA